jgi:hypothetical protein
MYISGGEMVQKILNRLTNEIDDYKETVFGFLVYRPHILRMVKKRANRQIEGRNVKRLLKETEKWVPASQVIPLAVEIKQIDDMLQDIIDKQLFIELMLDTEVRLAEIAGEQVSLSKESEMEFNKLNEMMRIMEELLIQLHMSYYK